MVGVETRAAYQWQTLADRELASAALEVALEVASRLRQPGQIETAVLEAKLQSDPKGGPQWAAHSLAQGYSGIALLFGYLDRCFPGDGWEVSAHEYLEIAAHAAATQASLAPSVFSGLGGLAYAASYLSRSGARYQRLLETLDRSLIAKLKPVVADLRAQCDGVNVQGFDVISGLSGLGVYLLGRLGFGDAREALEEVVGCLIELSQEHDGLPRWHTPSRLSSPDDFMLRQFPNGYLNGGLAHGAPGLLGTLALVRLGGVDREGLGEAIGRLAAWLATHRADDEWGVNWPTGVGLSPEGDRGSGTAAPSAAPPAPTGWCYGSPGVARALYLAGIALRKPEYCELAVRAIEAVLRRPASSRRIPSPTFCHGVAGLLEIVLRFANDVPSETMRDGATALTRQLLALYEPQSLLGFRSVALGGVRVDQPGLLDGAPGVALVLIASAREVEPAWDRIFLLS